MLVGIDGGDWDVLDPLAADLPALARVRERGATAPLRVSSASSPVSWTTLATGRSPDGHGIHQSPAGEAGFAARPDQVKVKRIWDMAGERGRRCAIVDWWITAPPYPVHGLMVSRESRETWPPGADLPGRDCPRLPHEADLRRLGLSSSRAVAMRGLLATGGYDLYLLPIYSVDQALHMLWSEAEVARDPTALASLPPATAARVRTGAALVTEAAKVADDLLQRAFAVGGDTGWIVVVSDHGFGPATPPVRRLALSRSLLDGGPGTAESGTFAVPPDGRTRVTLSASGTRHEGETPALSCDLSWPEITVEGPGAATVRARLLALRLPEGPPLVEPDGDRLVPTAAARIHLTEVLGRETADGWSVFVNTGAHTVADDGIFGVLGPGVVPGPLDTPVRSEDVTPTLLWLLGLPVGEDMEGAPVTAILGEEARSAHPVRRVATWEDGTRPWALPATTPLSPEEKERLKALGYIR